MTKKVITETAKLTLIAAIKRDLADDSTEQQVDFDRVITTVKDHRYDGDEDSVFEI